ARDRGLDPPAPRGVQGLPALPPVRTGVPGGRPARRERPVLCARTPPRAPRRTPPGRGRLARRLAPGPTRRTPLAHPRALRDVRADGCSDEAPADIGRARLPTATGPA